MAKKDKPGKQVGDLQEEADQYVTSLPDETAEGRLVGDSGAAADPTAWEAEEEDQQAAMRKPPRDM